MTRSFKLLPIMNLTVFKTPAPVSIVYFTSQQASNKHSKSSIIYCHVHSSSTILQTWYCFNWSAKTWWTIAIRLLDLTVDTFFYLLFLSRKNCLLSLSFFLQLPFHLTICHTFESSEVFFSTTQARWIENSLIWNLFSLFMSCFFSAFTHTVGFLLISNTIWVPWPHQMSTSLPLDIHF